MLEVLMYLFDHYINNPTSPSEITEAQLTEELEHAGFHESEIARALDWLEDLEKLQAEEKSLQTKTCPVRIYSPDEDLRLSKECKGFLLFLEQLKILDPVTREMVVDRAMALQEPLNLHRLKWVVLIVLLNRPGTEATLEWLEELIFNGTSSAVH